MPLLLIMIIGDGLSDKHAMQRIFQSIVKSQRSDVELKEISLQQHFMNLFITNLPNIKTRAEHSSSPLTSLWAYDLMTTCKWHWSIILWILIFNSKHLRILHIILSKWLQIGKICQFERYFYLKACNMRTIGLRGIQVYIFWKLSSRRIQKYKFGNCCVTEAWDTGDQHLSLFDTIAEG